MTNVSHIHSDRKPPEVAPREVALLDKTFEQLYDLLMDFDGHAFERAEAFIKEHRPDLNDRLWATRVKMSD